MRDYLREIEMKTITPPHKRALKKIDDSINLNRSDMDIQSRYDQENLRK